MNEEVISIDKVRAHAIAAATGHEAPAKACPYAFGSVASRLWMLEYTKAINRLQTIDRAQRAHIDIGPEAA